MLFALISWRTLLLALLKFRSSSPASQGLSGWHLFPPVCKLNHSAFVSSSNSRVHTLRRGMLIMSGFNKTSFSSRFQRSCHLTAMLKMVTLNHQSSSISKIVIWYHTKPEQLFCLKIQVSWEHFYKLFFSRLALLSTTCRNGRGETYLN